MSPDANPDVIIIGAGAAGIAAARRLNAAGQRVTVIEAASRIGGRAFTDTTTFGVPVDAGCAWASAARNPLLALPEWRRYSAVLDPETTWHYYDGTSRLERSAERGLEQAGSALEAGLERAGNRGRDIPVADVAVDGLSADARRWLPTAQAHLCQLDLGTDPADSSSRDLWEMDEQGDAYLVEQGYGSFIAALGAGLPVMLGTTANAIRTSGSDVSVETDRGTVRARACIVTVSTGVLRSGRLRFEAALEPALLRALDDLPMGAFTKVVLQFAPGSWLDEIDPLVRLMPRTEGIDAGYALCRPFGERLALCITGGSRGAELARSGEAVAIEWALAMLSGMLGGQARRGLVRGLLTDWVVNPLTEGAYSAARPGGYASRRVLEQPIAGRVFLAGEALGRAQATFVHGAWQSGERVAERLLAGVLA